MTLSEDQTLRIKYDNLGIIFVEVILMGNHAVGEAVQMGTHHMLITNWFFWKWPLVLTE